MGRFILISLLITFYLLGSVRAQLPPPIHSGGKITYEFSFKNYDQSSEVRDTFTLYYWNDPVYQGYNSLLFKNDTFIEIVEGWRKTTRLKSGGRDKLFVIDLNQWFLGSRSSLHYFPNLGIREFNEYSSSMNVLFETSSNHDSSILTYIHKISDSSENLVNSVYYEKRYSTDIGAFIYDSSYYSEFGENQYITYKLIDYDWMFFENITFEQYCATIMGPIYEKCSLVDYEPYKQSLLNEFRRNHKPINIGDTFQNLEGWVDLEGNSTDFYKLNFDIKDSSIDQYVILDFFYLNCGPCINMLKDLNLYKDSYPTNCQWISVNIANDSVTRIKKYFKIMRLEHDVIFNGYELLNGYETSGFPMTLVLNKQGVILNKVIGYYNGFHSDLIDQLSALNQR